MREPDYAAIAARLTCPAWLVIPAPYHRGLSAFAACTPHPLIIDDCDPDRLSTRMRAAEMAAEHAGQPMGVR
jgi:hypothetical protein